MAAPTTAQLTHALTTAGLPTPHPSFLSTILSPSSSGRGFPPLTSLVATAKLRLLNSDFSTSPILDPDTPSLPANTSDPKIVGRVLSSDVPVQILEIEDVGRSKWEQIEALEMERKGEMTKGREVIQVVPEQNEPSTAATQAPSSTNASAKKKAQGPFKVLFQDVKGKTVWGFELSRIEKLETVSIGAKAVLKKGCKVARGMVLLEPGSTLVLGGKIEVLDKKWREGREKRLRELVEKEAAAAATDAG